MEICIKWTMCRTCTTDSSSQLQPLYNDSNLAKQLQEYAGVYVKPDDGLPDQICTACIENLQVVHTFLSGCKRADEHLRSVVQRTMSTRKCFQNLSMEPDMADETAAKATMESRERKQIIAEQRHVNKGLSSQSLKSLLTTTRERVISKESKTQQISIDTELIHSDDCSTEELKSEESVPKAKSIGLSEKNDKDYLLVINSSQDQITDNEGNEYIITNMVDNDYEDIDEDDAHMEHDNETQTHKHLDETEKNSSMRVERYQLQESSSPAIDLGAACEPFSFPRHSCSICGNSFPNQTQLKSHLRTHGNEKIYECELCSKRFNAACNLTTHMRTHTGEKPYECGHCGRRFADRSTHRKHERMHTNERPYACDICAKTFTLSTTLKAHFLSHSQEKPHKCVTCNKGFRLPHQLKAHEKTHAHRYEVGIMLYNQEEEDDYSRS